MEAKFADYSAKIPKTGAPYQMVAIKGGEFLMGSPANEKDRDANEGPQKQVKISLLLDGQSMKSPGTNTNRS